MTISSPTRVLTIASGAYELVAQDGDVFEVTATGGLYLYFAAEEPEGMPLGSYVGKFQTSERSYTLSGMNCYARAAGTDCQIALNGTLADLP